MKGNRGFTLIELLVVISIIGMLSSVIFASIDSTRAKARDARRLSDMRQMVNALELYASNNNGRYPNTGSNYSNPRPWSWTISALGGEWIPGLNSQYIPSIPVDPKNTHPAYTSATDADYTYIYNSDGRGYCIQISLENHSLCNGVAAAGSPGPIEYTSPTYVGSWKVGVSDPVVCRVRFGFGGC